MQTKNKRIEIIIVSAIMNGVGFYLISTIVFMISDTACNTLISAELCNENPLMPIISWICITSPIIGMICGSILGWIMTGTKKYTTIVKVNKL